MRPSHESGHEERRTCAYGWVQQMLAAGYVVASCRLCQMPFVYTYMTAWSHREFHVRDGAVVWKA